MPSLAQLAANRANAQHSTGPQTPAGKQTVARNAVEHGLAGTFMILDWEIVAHFDTLVESLYAEHQPQTETERILVDRLAQHHWLAQRALTLQGECFAENGTATRLALYLRYQTTHERAFSRCLADLRQLRAARQRAEKEQHARAIGFASQKTRELAEHSRIALRQAKIAGHQARQAHWELKEAHAEAEHRRREHAHSTREALKTVTLEQKQVALELAKARLARTTPLGPAAARPQAA
jgi:hypothetical protein